MYTTIVVPLDGSRLAERAIPYARSLSAELLLVRAVNVRSTPWEEEGAGQRKAAASADAYLARVTGRRMLSSTKVRTEVYCAPAQDAILASARASGAQLIVMSTHGRAGLKRAIFGSVAEAILRRTDIPVLLVPPNCHRRWRLRHPHVVVALDGSALAASAIEPALTLTQCLKASLTLLYAVHISDAVDTEYGLEPLITDDADTYLHSLASDLRERGVSVASQVQDGEPADVIVAAAGDTRTAAVVLASRARRGLARAVLGNVPTSVLQRAESPVLIVRAAAAREAGRRAANGLQAYTFR